MNVVLLVMDTARAETVLSPRTFPDDTGLAETLKNECTSFEQAFASAPWTLPSHASLFTGTTPSKHGAHAGHKQLDDTYTTLAEVLSNEGYETVAVSNNTWISEEFGFGRGFEAFYKTWQYVQSDTDFGRIARQEEGIDKIRKAGKALIDGDPFTNLVNAVYGQFFRKANDDGATRTNAWIESWLTERNDARPFFLFVNYLEPHLEYRPPKAHAVEHLPAGVTYEEAMEVSQDAWGYIAGKVELTDEDFEILRELYRAEIAYLGEKIEEVVDLLKTHAEWEDTLFVLTSDHGENIGEHGLMDHQYALYDTLLHVPLYVHGGPFGDGEVDDLVQLLDIFPTILDVLGVEAPEVREEFQGVPFLPGAEETREYAIAEYISPQPPMDALERRVGILPEYIRMYDRSLRAIRTDRYKYIRCSDGDQELYNIETNPGETADIADSRENIIAELDVILNEWIESFETATHTEEVSMSKDTKSRLEDLGYLQ